MPSEARKAYDDFIDSLPPWKLDELPDTPRTLHHDDNFRLDFQGLTTDPPQQYNLQIQIQKGTKIKTLSKAKRSKKSNTKPTVTCVLVPKEDRPTSLDIIQSFKDRCTL